MRVEGRRLSSAARSVAFSFSLLLLFVAAFGAAAATHASRRRSVDEPMNRRRGRRSSACVMRFFFSSIASMATHSENFLHGDGQSGARRTQNYKERDEAKNSA